MSQTDRSERSPGIKLLFAALIGVALMIPLLLVYALVYDRKDQSQTAQAAINAGWGAPQVIAGPVLVVPFTTTEIQNETINGKTTTRAVKVERNLFVSPVSNRISTQLNPRELKKSIYRSVLFEADVTGTAQFALPRDLARFGVTRAQLDWNRAELRMGTSDARGLTKGGELIANGDALTVQPGKGPAATSGQGFFAFLPWDGAGGLKVDYSFRLRGSGSLSVVPRGGQTRWAVSSRWENPSFSGDFLPETRDVSDGGFTARYLVDQLALGQAPVATADLGPPPVEIMMTHPVRDITSVESAVSGPAAAMTVGLVEPVDLYSKVDRAVKYGFLFIGFTFLAFLLFDIVGGARVAAAEYLLTGAGLVLFFVLLLAFAEVVGFTFAYIIASGAIIGLLTSYSSAILRSWRRAGLTGALLIGLYALLFVLLSLEALSLLIGSVLLFFALAGVMFVTRNVEWSSAGAPEPSST